jgi:hypothetical protein
MALDISAAPAPARVAAAAGRTEATVYRLFDVGYAVDLDRAAALLRSSAPERVEPTRTGAQAIRIPNPPLAVVLGGEPVTIAGREHRGEVSARIFDFGAISLRMRIDAACTGWPEFRAFGARVHAIDLSPCFAAHLERLLARIAPAIEGPSASPITEDYVVFRMGRCDPAAPGDDEIAGLLLNETRPLAPEARRELLPHRFSYYGDDLVVPAWSAALVVEPNLEDTDVEYVLEFANAQLLQLRIYDAQLAAELPRIKHRVERTRRPVAVWLRSYAPVLGRLHTLVADANELMERVENSLRVTDDIYLARVYAAALDLFRWRPWRNDIDRKIAILRQTYELLNAEAQSRRAELLEIMIVLLIVIEIVLSFRR